jgi:16S rRNA (cytosine967-C5)-methyltransferase
LRKFVKQDVEFPTDKIDYLSIKYSYPKFAVEELIKNYGYQRTESIISAINEKTCLVFYDVDGKEYLTKNNISFENTPFSNVYLAKNFVRNADYDEGVYTYQALGSVAICEEVEPCEKLLDCCAAPGGKSIRLSYKCNEIVSFDIHSHRVELIEDYKKRMKRDNVNCFNVDAKIYDDKYKESFDAVLIDAPCSGLGVVNDNPDIKLNRTKDDVISLNEEQLQILKTVSNYVKKGGYIYYSTCSVLNSENIDIIDAFMSDVRDFKLCDINSKLPHETIKGTNAFLPDISGGLGFFVAKLKREN